MYTLITVYRWPTISSRLWDVSSLKSVHKRCPRWWTLFKSFTGKINQSLPCSWLQKLLPNRQTSSKMLKIVKRISVSKDNTASWFSIASFSLGTISRRTSIFSSWSLHATSYNSKQIKLSGSLYRNYKGTWIITWMIKVAQMIWIYSTANLARIMSRSPKGKCRYTKYGSSNI
jgi:hypothetical protein